MIRLLIKTCLAIVLGLMAFVSTTANEGEEKQAMATTIRQVVGSGFHLALETRLSLAGNNPNEFTNCKVALIERLPSGAFIDPDETRESARFFGMGGARVDVHTKPFVDVEKPEYMSMPCEAQVTWHEHTWSQSFRHAKIPFHLRYHAPNDRGYAHCLIPPPIICSTCSLKEFILTESDVKDCEQRFGPSFKSYESSLSSFIAPKLVDVPVGFSGEQNLIVFSTISIVVIGAVVLICFTC